MEIFYQDVDKALCRTNINLADFVLNPYRGCSIGCKYCYAQYNKGIKKLSKEWGKFVIVKKNFLSILEKELEEKTNIKKVLIGSTTEPFQPVEREAGLSIGSIRMLKRKEIPFVLLTKQPFIASFVDELTYHPENTIYFTINSEDVRKIFEENSQPTDERINAIEKLYINGINVIAYIGPYFPFLTDYTSLFRKLEGKVKLICIEAYHPGMGNSTEILKIAPFLKEIISNHIKYYEFWEELKEKIKKECREYGYKIKLIVPDLRELSYKTFSN